MGCGDPPLPAGRSPAKGASQFEWPSTLAEHAQPNCCNDKGPDSERKSVAIGAVLHSMCPLVNLFYESFIPHEEHKVLLTSFCESHGNDLSAPLPPSVGMRRLSTHNRCLPYARACAMDLPQDPTLRSLAPATGVGRVSAFFCAALGKHRPVNADSAMLLQIKATEEQCHAWGTKGPMAPVTRCDLATAARNGCIKWPGQRRAIRILGTRSAIWGCFAKANRYISTQAPRLSDGSRRRSHADSSSASPVTKAKEP